MSKTGREFAQEFSRFVNNYATDIEGFSEEVTRDHRTIQQNTFRLMVACIEKWAAQEQYDLRNEATVKACKEIVAKVESIKFLPYV